jgi:hypothetical protein
MASARRYDLVLVRSSGERARPYATAEELEPGHVLVVGGRYWLVDRVEQSEEDRPARAYAQPARYRLRLRHPDGNEEIGAFRRYRPDAPRLGHAFSTNADGRQLAWEVVDELLARDERGEPYLDLVAARDFEEVEQPPDHELEHTLARGEDDERRAAAATMERAEREGLSVELVALDEGEVPEWDAAARFIDALILEELEDDLIELCGIDPRTDPRDTWLDVVKDRLRADLTAFRADVEGDHDEIEQWDFGGARIFAALGTPDDEADPDKGYGWMCRLIDSEAYGAAGFERVRKAQL